jgi:hypothetical protein
MSDFGVSFVLGLVVAIKASIEVMVANKELARQLSTRLEVLQAPIEQLSVSSVRSAAGINNLATNLKDLQEFVGKLSKRSAFSRFFKSGDDKKAMVEFDVRIGQCVVDLNLLLSIRMESRIDRILSTVEEDKITPAIDRLLTNAGAKDFYVKYFHNGTTLKWHVFWINFSIELEYLDIAPNPGLEQELRVICDLNQDGLVTPKGLNALFQLWENPIKRKKLIKKAAKGVNLTQFLDKFTPPYTHDLVLKVIKVNPSFPYELRVNDVITLKPLGLPASRRYVGDRITRFGRFDGSKNDVNLSPDDVDISRDMFQILCNSDGYYIADSANIGGTCLRLRPDVPTKLHSGMIFVVGGNVFLRVVECLDSSTQDDTASSASSSEPSVKLEVIKGEGEGKTFQFSNSARVPDFIIGHKAPGKAKAIEFNDPQVSRQHAKISFTFSGWHLTDLSSRNGTWRLLINFDNVSSHVVTPPVKVSQGDVFGAQFYHFECLT